MLVTFLFLCTYPIIMVTGIACSRPVKFYKYFDTKALSLRLSCWPLLAAEMPIAGPFRRASAKRTSESGNKVSEEGQETIEKARNGSDDTSSNYLEQQVVSGESMLLGQPNSPDLLGIENTDPADIHYKTCKWWQTGILMVAETISLGILSLPSVLSKVGLIPGIILIFGMGLFATYSGYVMYQFKLEYPWVRSMADAGEVMFKPWGDKAKQVGRELGGAAQTIFLVFSMASHILTWTICFDILTDHTVCNVVWGIVALIVFWIFDLPRTLRNMSYFSIACK